MVHLQDEDDNSHSHDSPSSEDNQPATGTASAPREAKRLWSPAEDESLVAIVHKFGASRWSLIATHVPGRAGKQCRERWFNHLCPEVKKGEWSTAEDETLLRAVAELGSQWSIIVKRMHGRTDNAIKNRYNTIQRRSKTGTSSSLAQQLAGERWSSPDGASPGSGSDSAGTPKRARDDGRDRGDDDDDVACLRLSLDAGADTDGGSAAEPIDAMDDVFGALLAGMPPTPQAAVDASRRANQHSPKLALPPLSKRRERIAALAAEIGACNVDDASQHAHIDALIEQLVAASGAPASHFVAPPAADATRPAVAADEPAGRAGGVAPAKAATAAHTGRSSGHGRARPPAVLPTSLGDAAAVARSRGASVLSLSPLQIDEPATAAGPRLVAVASAEHRRLELDASAYASCHGQADEPTGSPPKRARAAEPAADNIEQMLESFFPDCAGAGGFSLPDAMLLHSPFAPYACADAKGAPLTPSSALGALVGAF